MALKLGFLILVAAALISCGPDRQLTASEETDLATIVTSFDAYPTVWLGESFDIDGDGLGDLELTSAYPSGGQALPTTQSGQVVLPAIQSFVMGYGDCEIPFGDQSCPIPLTIVVYPPNSGLLPLAEAVILGNSIMLRGVEATPYNEGLWIETADFTIAIAVASGDRYEQSIRVAQQLVGANPKASHITAGSDFRPLPATPTVEATAVGTPSPEIGLTPDVEETVVIAE